MISESFGNLFSQKQFTQNFYNCFKSFLSYSNDSSEQSEESPFLKEMGSRYTRSKYCNGWCSIVVIIRGCGPRDLSSILGAGLTYFLPKGDGVNGE